MLSLTNATALPPALKEIVKWVEVLGVMLFVTNAVSARASRVAVACLLLAGDAQALLGTYQFFARSGSEFFRIGRFVRAYGTFEQPNPYGGYLGQIAPLALALSLSLLDPSGPRRRPRAGLRSRAPYRWLQWLALGSFILISAAIGMSGSRGAWLAFALAFAAVNLIRSRRGAVLFVALIGLAALLATVSGARLLPRSVEQRLTSFLPFVTVRDVTAIEITDENYASVERLAFWQAALAMWRDHPWLGVGFGNYQASYGRYALPKWPMALGHAHNYYLNVAAETGLVGLVAYLILWGAAFWQTGKAMRGARTPYARAVALGTLGMLVHVSAHNLVDNLWVHNMYIQTAILLGLVYASAYNVSPAGQPRAGPRSPVGQHTVAFAS
jgi:putative inorganic carbon (HCO3(-)) transporter